MKKLKLFLCICLVIIVFLNSCQAKDLSQNPIETLSESEETTTVADEESTTLEGDPSPLPSEPISFSSSAAPASLPNSKKGIEGVFVADFENKDDYFQAIAAGNIFEVLKKPDGSVMMFSEDYSSKIEIANGSSGTAGLNLYAKNGQNLSMRTQFYVKNRPDMRNYSGMMLYVDTRHSKMANIGFVDGHVSRLPRQEITNERSAGFLK